MRLGVAVVLGVVMPSSSALAESQVHLNGAEVGLGWSLPFVGILLSIALFPLLTPRFWEHNFGKFACVWAGAFIVPCGLSFGLPALAAELLHTVAAEYLPFMILLFALFVVAGGIRIVGNLVGTPRTNTALLAVGTLSASVLGTTGASMLLIRPVIRANQDRRHNRHVFVFFIFLVSNIGGSLSPLGDPPLFLGYLKGVDFFWTLSAMAGPMLLASSLLLALFYVVDRRAWHREAPEMTEPSQVPRRARVEGMHNAFFLAGVVVVVMASGIWQPDWVIPIGLGVERPVAGIVRDVVLLALSYLSRRTTRPSIRIENAFTWTPIQEVAILFAGIFITMIPALAILRAGRDGAMAPLLGLISGADGHPVNAAYFWLTGVLSSFLDNAPTYLVFFNLAGGDAQALMGPLASTLLAISAGAVFMGANSYIGNAPNFGSSTSQVDLRISGSGAPSR